MITVIDHVSGGLNQLTKTMINNRNLLFKGFVLALCIISSVHVFLFPLYENRTRTYLDLEPSLCKIGIQKRSTVKTTIKCPQSGILTVKQDGELGNQLWEFATIWVLARRTGLESYIPRCIKVQLNVIFDKLSVPTFDQISHCPIQPIFYVDFSESAAKVFDTDWNFAVNKTIILQRFTKQPELISTWVQEILQEFSIRKRLLQKSQKILHAAAKSLNRTFETFIGVHVRRFGYIHFLESSYSNNIPIAPPAGTNFFTNAMQYYEDRYRKPVFIFVSDDPNWCWRKFGKKKNVFVTGKRVANSPVLDMAVLASCNHSIFDYGTFGEWGSILAGGETIFYNLSYVYSAKLGKFKNWHTI